MVSIDDLWEVVRAIFNELIIKPLKSNMARSAILKIDMMSFFSAEGGPIWKKNFADWCRMTCRLQ